MSHLSPLPVLRERVRTYLRGSIPQLTIVDRHGKIIADSWTGNAYVGPKQAMARAIQSGAAK